MDDGKYATHSKEFYLKEYECLRKEIEWLLGESRALERNVVIAVGVTWGWLVDRSLTSHVPKWAWLIPCLFAGLGALRARGMIKQFGVLHEYLERTESAFSSDGDPGGWEHFARRGWTAKSTFLFWLFLILATFGVALYELKSN